MYSVEMTPETHKKYLKSFDLRKKRYRRKQSQHSKKLNSSQGGAGGSFMTKDKNFWLNIKQSFRSGISKARAAGMHAVEEENEEGTAGEVAQVVSRKAINNVALQQL